MQVKLSMLVKPGKHMHTYPGIMLRQTDVDESQESLSRHSSISEK